MPSPARLQLLSLARRFLPEADGPITIVIKANGVRVVIAETAEDGQAPAINLSPVERAIIRVATDRPQTAKALARLAGYRYSTHTRSAMASLCRKNLLIRKPEGYAVVSG